MKRLTKSVRDQLLEQNEGYTIHTFYEGKNYRESRTYKIENGLLHIFSGGKTSWADSRFEDDWIATEEQTHRFLYKYGDSLNWDDI